MTNSIEDSVPTDREGLEALLAELRPRRDGLRAFSEGWGGDAEGHWQRWVQQIKIAEQRLERLAGLNGDA